MASSKTTDSSGTTSGNTSGTTAGTFNSSATPTNPGWVDQTLQNYTQGVNNIAGTNPANFVPGASALQTQAFGQAGTLAQPSGLFGSAASEFGNAQGAVSAANNSTTPQVTGATIDPTVNAAAATAFGGINNYLNPYLGSVVDTTMADFDHSADQQRTADALSAARNSSLPGSGFAVQRALTDGELARGRATTDAGLRSGAYTFAADQAQQDAQRAQAANLANASAANARSTAQAGLTQDASTTNAGLHNDVLNRYLTSAGILGNLGTAYGSLGSTADASNRANVGLLGDLGSQQRDINGQVAQAPLSVQEQIAQLLQGGQFGLFHGQDTTGATSGTESGTTSGTSTGTSTTSDPMGGFGGLLSAGGSLLSGAAAFSDSGLKRDIETAGYDAKGRRWVNFNYHWDEPDAPKRRGVIAQEVRETDPEAVFVHPPSGYLMVDYAQLGD